VVFTGRDLTPEEDAKLHTMARSIVVKGAASPERLFDETALFCTRSPTTAREKKKMLERLHSSDEMLAGRTGAGGRRRHAQHLRAVERARARGMRVLTATTGPRGDLHPRTLARGRRSC
jgi:hypothetical protein